MANTSILEGGKGELFDKMLYLRDDESVKIRMIPGMTAKKIFIHTCKDNQNRFIDVYCAGPQAGCPFCAVNFSPPFAKVENKLRPYPGRTRYISPVYVYDKNVILLLGGKEVWQAIENINVTVGNIYDRDIIVRRTRDRRVTYTAVAEATSAFTTQINPASIPKVDEYIKWLTNNINKVVMTHEGNVPVTTPTSTTAYSAPVDVMPVITAQSTPVPASAISTKLAGVLNIMGNLTFSQEKFMASLHEAAPGKTLLKDLTDAELDKFIGLYQK